MHACLRQEDVPHRGRPELLTTAFAGVSGALDGIASRAMLDASWRAAERFEHDELLRQVDRMRALPACRQDAAACRQRRDERDVLVAIGYLWRDDAEQALALAGDVLARPLSPRMRMVLLTVIRYACWKMRRLDALYELSAPRLYRTRRGVWIPQVVNLSIEAAAEAEQLRLKLAERHARRAIELSERASGHDAKVALLSRCVLAAVTYEMGDMEQAQALLRSREAAIDQHGGADAVMWGRTTAFRLAMAQGHRAQASRFVRMGIDTCRQKGWTRLAAYFAALEIVAMLADGRTELAGRALARAQQNGATTARPVAGFDVDTWPLEAARLRIAFAIGDYTAAAAGFRLLGDWLRGRHLAVLAVRFAALAAGSLYRAGRKDDACADMLCALERGAAAGLFRTFVDELSIIGPCLQWIRSSRKNQLGHLHAYINGILVTCEAGYSHDDARQTPDIVLSQREIGVLDLVSRGYSNKGAARELHIAPETVKSHMKRIAVKLSTRTRAEAVACAKSMGMI
ncbi:LuxR C-terminal-related transcriptional regulator [Dyella sp. A6]|uniref:LuxR C-terminal-related transcriptional regulator n=1 Tax=Dyella aluminiiresistens TaxID=3069105 RepID=UPI002E7663B5|nr:LuxR C-terminal-related transcriptional regulator [Dyella sp. A6]